MGTEHYGSFRVKLEYSTCGDVCLLAQQIYNPKDEVWTFRKWNPDMLGAAYGEDTTADDVKDAGWFRWLCCCCCVIAGKILNLLCEESIFMIQEEHGNPKEMLKKSDREVQKMGCCLRPTGIILSILGWYMLFIPTIKLFQWIPLVGKMLGWIVSGVAFLVGLLCGG